MTIEIPLTQGKVALIDDEDLPLVSGKKWHATKAGHGGGSWYARHHCQGGRKNRTFLLLHRVILNVPEGMKVDHRDGNGLNCCRDNLRICTDSQNQWNKRPYRNNKSGYKGVSWYTSLQRWVAVINVSRRAIYLGSFKDVELAAQAYDKAAEQHFGSFAYLNFPKLPRNQITEFETGAAGE